MALFAIITRNVLEYICKNLSLQILVQLYKQILDRSNITYIVKEIKEKDFKELDVLVSQTERISDIPKTMIFVDRIDDGIKMTQYFRLLLSESICKKGYQII